MESNNSLPIHKNIILKSICLRKAVFYSQTIKQLIMSFKSFI